jgi:hypothetical protein
MTDDLRPLDLRSQMRGIIPFARLPGQYDQLHRMRRFWKSVLERALYTLVAYAMWVTLSKQDLVQCLLMLP